MNAKFSKGDRVIVKVLGNKIGIINGEPNETKVSCFLQLFKAKKKGF